MRELIDVLNRALAIRGGDQAAARLPASVSAEAPSPGREPLDLSEYRLGGLQRAGALTVVPLLGQPYPGQILPPRSGLKLSRVVGYGNVELVNSASEGVAIVPLHMGYIQYRAQNHALCRSAFLAAGQKLLFDDACCVQESQGGYLTERDQWFFVLPLELRDEALSLRGQSGYAKLWPAISRLNVAAGLPDRGHLEQILSRQRAILTQYQSRLELLPGQLGALFFLENHLVGVEVAPSEEYFQDLWMALVCFAYGVAAWRLLAANGKGSTAEAPEPFQAATLAELRAALERSRREVEDEVQRWLAEGLAGEVATREEERFMDLRLYTVQGKHLAGQYIAEDERLVYASLFARSDYLSEHGLG